MAPYRTVLALLVLWFLSTLLLGGVAHPYERTHLLLVSLIAGVALFSRSSDRTSNPYPFDRRFVGLTLLIACVGLLQLIDIPNGLLRLISPLTHRLTVETVRDLSLNPIDGGYSTSLMPQATAGALGQLLAFGLLIATSLIALHSPRIRTRVGYAICSITAGIAFFGLIHRFSGSPKMFWLFERGWTFFGPYVSANHAGALFATAGAIGLGLLGRPLKRVDRIAWMFMLGIILLGLLFTGSRAALLSMTAVVVINYFVTRNGSNRPRYARSALVALAIAVGFAAVVWKANIFSRIIATPSTMTAGSEFRTQFWIDAVQLWSQSPWFGVGFGAYAKASPLLGSDLWLHAEHAENDYLEIFATGGVLAALPLFLLLFLLFRRIFRTLRNPDASITRKAFGLGLTALAVNSFFVFNAPLPAHQILAAILIGGFLASRDRSLLAHRSIAVLFAAGVFTGLVFGVRSLIFQPIVRAPQISTWSGNSPANLRASLLIRNAELETEVPENPLNSSLLYEFSRVSAGLGKAKRATKAYESAVRIAPFHIYERVRTVAVLDGDASGNALVLIDRLLDGSGPVPRASRIKLLTEATTQALLLPDHGLAQEYFGRLESLAPADWKISMLQSNLERDPIPVLRESWRRSRQQEVPIDTWDRALLFFLHSKKLLSSIDLNRLVQTMGPVRPDIGTFLLKLSRLHGDVLSVRLDKETKSPRYRPNTPITAGNTNWITEEGSMMVPEEIEVSVDKSQSNVDAYLLPVSILASPQNLSFRLRVSGKSTNVPRLVLKVEEQYILNKKEDVVREDDSWILYFRNVGEIPSDDDTSKPFRITGVGFTPLEHNGRYAIGPLEVFLDSPR